MPRLVKLSEKCIVDADSILCVIPKTQDDNIIGTLIMFKTSFPNNIQVPDMTVEDVWEILNKPDQPYR